MADLSNLGVKIPIFPEPKDIQEKETQYAIKDSFQSVQDAFNKNTSDIDAIIIPTVPSASTQAQAEAGTNNDTFMTPLRVTNALAVTAPDKSSNQYYSSKATCTTTLDWDNGNVQYIVLASGAQTFTFDNPKDGGRYILILKQPASGAAGTVTFPNTVLWSSGTTVVLSTTNSKVDVISLIYDGTNSKYYAGFNLNF